MKNVDVAIIGAGTAGLSAYKEASKVTKNIVLIDHGPLGTTCARVGCMPSKLLIDVANKFHVRKHFEAIGISGGDSLSVNLRDTLSYVRKLRDYFTSGVIRFTESLGSHFISGEASFLDTQTLQVNQKTIRANKIILATGSQSIIPHAWHAFDDRLLTSETIFEQTELPQKIGVAGGGVIGLELGQALARLGLEVSLFHGNAFLAALTDPTVNKHAIEIFKKEFSLCLGEKVDISANNEATLNLTARSHQTTVDKALISIGRASNLKRLALDKIGITCNAAGVPQFDNTTMKVNNHDIYLAGDINKTRPLLHEAADDGRIAGFNAARPNDKIQCFKRRTPITIIFTQPNIIVVGKPYRELKEKDFVVGSVSFEDQGRARVMHKNQGILNIYAEKATGCLLGCEGVLPDGEHIAHLLAWAIKEKLTVFKVLQMPFYHPVIEEGMRTALRDLANKVDHKAAAFELAMCDSAAESPLS